MIVEELPCHVAFFKRGKSRRCRKPGPDSIVERYDGVCSKLQQSNDSARRRVVIRPSLQCSSERGLNDRRVKANEVGGDLGRGECNVKRREIWQSCDDIVQ